MSDFLDDNQLLDHIRRNLIDVENEQQKTNELLGQVLEELKKLNFVPEKKKEDRFSWPVFQTVQCDFCGWQEPNIVSMKAHIRERH